ncbi:MAG: SPFH domain-containing protein [Bryobacteraceae bacterium]|jgi:regulator of protease activity HflC (stomatin/prohibitin superfamily)
MLFVKYSLSVIGIGLLLAAAGIPIHDFYRIFKKRDEQLGEPRPVEWRPALRLAIVGFVALLAGLSIVLVPSGEAGVLVSQFGGARPGPLYPGVHFIVPLVDRIELFSIRDRIFATTLNEDAKKKSEVLRVQTKEGLSVGLAVTVRFRFDPRRLPWMESNLPQPVETEIVPPMVVTAFRDATPGYMVRELFATRREEIVRGVAGEIARRLAPDGVVVKEVMVTDIELPEEYAKGLEGLLLKEQENDRMSVELEVKQKMVQEAEFEADADKVHEIKAAEAKAEETVLEAKAQADAMQHTLPLKQKQIEQSRLEAEARKEATVMNAEAMAQAKVIDGKAELERRRLMTQGDADHIRTVASADADRMKLESDVIRGNPLLIQKIIADKLSDKVQIMMVPNDGKFFFANDVLKAPPAETSTHPVSSSDAR